MSKTRRAGWSETSGQMARRQEIFGVILNLHGQFTDIIPKWSGFGQHEDDYKEYDSIIRDAITYHVIGVLDTLRKIWYVGVQSDFLKERISFWNEVLIEVKK